MIQNFPVTFSSNVCALLKEARPSLDVKGCHELRDVFEFLRVWQDHYRARFGELREIVHLSNPDDPPDAIAIFDRGEFNLEVTTITPAHIFKWEKIPDPTGRNRGRCELPISRRPANAAEAIDLMYGPGGADIWEPVADRNQTWFDSIIARAKNKFTKQAIQDLPEGVLLLPSQLLNGGLGEEAAIKAAFNAIRSEIPPGTRWTLAVCNPWNPIEYFSAIYESGSDFISKVKIADRPPLIRRCPL